MPTASVEYEMAASHAATMASQAPAEELADGVFYEHTCIALDRMVDDANVTKPATPSQSIHSYTSGADGR